jgi:hypothetical protein
MADKGVRIEFTNLDELYKRYERAPENFVKITKECMKEGGKQVTKMIRGRSPAEYRRLVGYKIGVGQVTKDSYIFMGFFNKDRKKKLKEVPRWFKAYWKNYGTLTKRYAGHQFRTPVKGHSRRRRNNVGQNAELWYEGTIQGWKGVYLDAFEKKLKENEDKILSR